MKKQEIYYVKNIQLKEKVSDKYLKLEETNNMNNHYKTISQNDSNVKKKKVQKLNTLCLQEKSRRLSLILMQDDKDSLEKIYNIINIKTKKEPLPLFSEKKIKNKKKIELSNEKILRYNNSDKNNIIDINKLFIKDLQYSINNSNNNSKKNIFNSGKDFYTLNSRMNNLKKNIFLKTFNNEKIKKLSPEVSEKILFNKKNLPINYKNLKENLKKNLSLLNKKINLDEILFYHNSNMRKAISQFKVKNYNFHYNLKLKDKKLFNLTNRKTNKEENFFFKKNLNDIYL